MTVFSEGTRDACPRQSLILKGAMEGVRCLALVFALLASGWCEGAGFRASAVRVEITPKTPQWLHGYGPRKSEGVHDPIFHRIVAMDDGTTQVFWIVSDICTVTPSFRDAICERLRRESGIHPDQVWWMSTHTHSAPHVGPQDLGQLFGKTLGDRFSMTHDEGHWAFVADGLVSGVQKARAELRPARFGMEVGRSEANVNRRERRGSQIVLGNDPEGVVDQQLGLIRLESTGGALIALVANYAVHATALGGVNRLISGDVPGRVSAYVESQVGGMTLFVNGAEGNVGPRYNVGGDFEHPSWAAYDHLLGDVILELDRSIREKENGLTDGVRLRADKTTVVTRRKPGLGWLEELSAYSTQTADGEPGVKIPIWSIVVNDSTAIWGAPLELFCEIAIAIRRDSPFDHTLYFGLTNGSLLYLPTAQAFEEGGYETGVTPYTPDAEGDVVRAVGRHLRRQAR